MHYGLIVRETKQLAYQYAIKNDIKIPENWKKSETAETEWFYLFLNCTKLSIRMPEATSLSRKTSFNRTNVDTFFKNLDSVQKRYKFSDDCIYNIDETALSTVHKPAKVVAGKGVKQVGQVTSAERGTLVTMIGCINALGNSIPPFLIFPSVHFRSCMLKGAPTGTKGDANPSGWINTEIFLKWFDHFVQYGHPSQYHPLLLIMDNHKSHISIEFSLAS
ncbi:uncharacterized protein LOC101240490 [Hydra vulgaris]|uniref:uncharacterized protein LOC101240490 n=1 Tax=Hydra vulgaris TaxID=6087 RepID=UPI001F5FE495|nr:uncharacterized protein LOC101240490 [Hydra vulgaris]